jgi:hypothetical protein
MNFMESGRNKFLAALAALAIILSAGAFGWRARGPSAPAQNAPHATSASSNPAGALQVGNTAVSGAIGALTAAQTVDVYSNFVLTQTTAGVAGTLPNPTNVTAGRVAFVSSSASSTAALTMYGAEISPGTGSSFQWDSAKWSVIGNGAQSNVFTYQQGGTAGVNIFTTWAGAYAAAAAVQNLAPTIVIDGSLGTPVVPSGTYDVGGMTLRGVGFFTNFQLTAQEGSHFTATKYDNVRLDSLILDWQNTSSAFFTLGAGQNLEVSLLNSAGILADVAATKPFISIVSGSGNVTIAANGALCALTGSASAPVLSSGAGAPTAFIFLGQNASVGANTITGAGPITVTLMDTSPVLVSTQTGATNVTVKQGPSNAKPALSLSAAGGAQALPARTSVLAAPTPSWFLATPSGNQAATTTYTLQVAGAYQPLDIVRVLFNKTQLAGANVTVVDGGSGTPTLGIIIAASVGANGSGYIEAQLNAAGTHWTLLSAGSQ